MEYVTDDEKNKIKYIIACGIFIKIIYTCLTQKLVNMSFILDFFKNGDQFVLFSYFGEIIKKAKNWELLNIDEYL